MKKLFPYVALAMLGCVVTPVTALSKSAHSGPVGKAVPMASAPWHGIHPTHHHHHDHDRFVRRHHHRHDRFQPFDFAFGGLFPDWGYTPESVPYGPDRPATEYAPQPEDWAPRIPTRCVSETQAVPSERGGQVQVTVTRCNVPILLPSRARSAPPATDLK
jgi:hypothetical protein